MTVRLVLVISAVFVSEATLAMICMPPAQGMAQVCSRLLQFDLTCTAQKKGSLAWDENSCLAKKQSAIQKQMEELTLLEQMPAEVYSKNSAKDIAEALIFRFFRANEAPQMSEEDISHPNVDIYHDTSLLMAVKPESFGSILDRGFLNQFQTGRSSGTYTPTLRATAESLFIGLDLGKNLPLHETQALNTLRPKYAYLTFDVGVPNVGTSWITHQYGNVFFRFKDHVKRRTTFSNGDSLDHFIRPRGYKYAATDFKSSTFFNSKKNFDIQILSSYYEAQIWGPLTKEDVDYILVGCFLGIPDDQDKIVNELKLRKLRIPVYSCESKMNQTKFLGFKPKTKIYPNLSERF